MADPRETFECGPSLRIEAQERLVALQFAQLNTHMVKIEAMMDRLERRLWLAVYGVVAVILAQGVEQILNAAP